MVRRTILDRLVRVPNPEVMQALARHAAPTPIRRSRSLLWTGIDMKGCWKSGKSSIRGLLRRPN